MENKKSVKIIFWIIFGNMAEKFFKSIAFSGFFKVKTFIDPCAGNSGDSCGFVGAVVGNYKNPDIFSSVSLGI